MAAKNNVTPFAPANSATVFDQDRRGTGQKIVDVFTGNPVVKAAQEARSRAQLEAIGQAEKTAVAKIRADGDLARSKIQSEMERQLSESACTALEVTTQGQSNITQSMMQQMVSVENVRNEMNSSVADMEGLSPEQKQRLNRIAEGAFDFISEGAVMRGKHALEAGNRRFESNFGPFFRPRDSDDL